MLAQGGMAEVWLAVDLTLDRKVAVKWLKPNLASDPVVTERFRREAIAAASLNHPNIVAVHDVFEQDGRQAVVMQLVEGKSLRQVLDTQKRLSPELTCHIGSCVAAALDHAHDAGFIHRDVKPGNIMMTSDGRVLLTDFGIAKGVHAPESDLTSDNIMMGTAKYLSPEQVRGKKLDGRADLYSLGLVLYECLAGRVPFLGETDADTALARLQRDPTDLTRLRATLPTKLVVTIHQLLARNPAHRPASGAELVTTLRDAARDGPPPVDPTPYERSPVSPFGSRRLRRAPSDIAGRAQDRARTTHNPATTPLFDDADVATPVPAARSTAPFPPSTPDVLGDHLLGPMIPGAAPTTRSTIPGEVGHLTAPLPPVRPRVDRTPPSGQARGKPAKGMTQEWKPAFTVVALLFVAGLVVVALLWSTLEFGGEEPSATTTAAPSASTATPPPAEPAAIAPGVATIATLTAYDPGGDNTENDADAVLATADGNPDTSWKTVCYADKYLGGKPGVGLVVSFDEPTQQPVSVDVLSAPYQLDFYATDAETIPAALDGWGSALGSTVHDVETGTITSPAPTSPARHVLILLRELGNDGTCSDANPYRGRLGEISAGG